jgi:ubiquinone/menaquinone biosynthesis C-methylase UbiE
MKPENTNDVQNSFTVQAHGFESEKLNFSNREYLGYTLRCMNLKPADSVLEAAAGTCICGRSIAPFVHFVTCLDATPAMLEIGKKQAAKDGVSNIRFVNGYVEDIPFPNEHFDIVFTRFSFHHFIEMNKPFAEMHRVLKRGGQLIVVDMEAADESFRCVQDKIEKMRDSSHIRNHSQAEFIELYQRYGYKITKQEVTKMSVSLSAWLALTETPDDVKGVIKTMMKDEMNDGRLTGFYPYMGNDGIYFEQRWVLFIGEKIDTD